MYYYISLGTLSSWPVNRQKKMKSQHTSRVKQVLTPQNAKCEKEVNIAGSYTTYVRTDTSSTFCIQTLFVLDALWPDFNDQRIFNFEEENSRQYGLY